MLQQLRLMLHITQVVGGSRFSPNYDYDDLITSQCSTITVQADKSNYWAVGTLLFVISG